MMKFNIEVKDLVEGRRYVVDLGQELENLYKHEMDQWRVFGNLDVYEPYTMEYVGTLSKMPYSAVY